MVDASCGHLGGERSRWQYRACLAPGTTMVFSTQRIPNPRSNVRPALRRYRDFLRKAFQQAERARVSGRRTVASGLRPVSTSGWPDTGATKRRVFVSAEPAC